MEKETARLQNTWSGLLAAVTLIAALSIAVNVAELLTNSHIYAPNGLTFELPSDKRMCFYHDIQIDGKYSFHFKAIESDKNFTVNADLESPSGRKLYSTTGRREDKAEFDVMLPGTFMFCFSLKLGPVSPPANSTTNSSDAMSQQQPASRSFARFDVQLLQAGSMWLQREEKRIKQLENSTGVSDQIDDTLMQEALARIIQSSQKIIEFQTMYRGNEEVGSQAATRLNGHVLWWSFAQSVVLLITGFGQVILLKLFFTEKRNITVIAMDVGQQFTQSTTVIPGLPIRP